MEKENPQNKDVKKEENIQQNNTLKKKNFFKKLWYSIDKIDKYSELSAEGFVSAIKYLSILIIILALILSGLTIIRANKTIKDLSVYIQDNAPELTYSDGKLSVDTQDTIVDENNDFGKVIIDTKTEDEEQINKYIEEINDEDNALVILNNQIILKEANVQGTTIYKYSDLLAGTNITEFNKQDLVNYLTSSQMTNLYLNLFIVLSVNAFIIYFINTMVNVLLISLFGYLATMILKLKIRYVAVLNMAIYAITLPTILNIIYIIINSVFGYMINYFDIMYILVASIYMIASIFILKSEFNKKQGEVQKIIEVEKQVKEEVEEKETENKKEEDKTKNKETKKEDNKENKKEQKGKNGEIGQQGLEGEGEV